MLGFGVRSRREFSFNTYMFEVGFRGCPSRYVKSTEDDLVLTRSTLNGCSAETAVKLLSNYDDVSADALPTHRLRRGWAIFPSQRLGRL